MGGVDGKGATGGLAGVLKARNRKDKVAITAYLLIGGPLSIHNRLRARGEGRKGRKRNSVGGDGCCCRRISTTTACDNTVR